MSRLRLFLAFSLVVVLLLGSLRTLPPSPPLTSSGSKNLADLHPAQTPPPSGDCGVFTSQLHVITPSPSSGPPGTHLVLVGSGFYSPGKTGYVQIWLTDDSGNVLLSLDFIPSGTAEPFTVTVDMPGVGVDGRLALGTYYLWALNDTEPSNCAEVEFNLTATDAGLACENWSPELRVISPSPAIGVAGQPARLRGIGFYDDNLTDIYWATQTGGSLTYLKPVTSNATGGFNLTLDVPTGFTPGLYVFWANAGTSDYDCAATMFNLTAGPTLGVTPSSGVGTTIVAVTGSGFSASDTSITITGAVLLFPLPCTLSGGSITGSCSFQVDGGLAGPQNITGVGNVVGGPTDTGLAVFTLYPMIIISPSSGPLETSFTITGLDFSADPAAADVTFDGQLLTPTGGSDCAPGRTATLITPDSEGEFVCTFTVPGWATLGPNSVQGDDTSTGELTAAETFTLEVGPNLVLTPASGPGASLVTVTGSGFSASDTSITITGAMLLFPLPCALSAGTVTGSCAFQVDGGLAGQQTVTGAGNVVGGPSDTATATFRLFPSVALNQSSGLMGTSFTITGFDFSADPAAAAVTFDGQLLTPTGGSDCAPGTTDTLITPDSLGGFVCTFSVPGWATSGSNSLQGDDTSTGELTAAETFTLEVGPSLVLTPASGAGTAIVVVTGSGFSTSDTSISITGAVLLLPLPCTLSGGSITGSCSFDVDGGLAGVQTITGVGNVVGGPSDTGTATFTLDPTIILSPTSGPIGTSFSITGIDFSAGPAAAAVAFDGDLLTPTGGPDCASGSSDTLITPDSFGGFNCTFTVPAWATSGANSVRGDDTNTQELTIEQTFTRTVPYVGTVSSRSGSPGPVTFTVTGLAPDISYFVYLDLTQGAPSGALYNPIGECTTSAAGTLTDCQVTIPSGLASGKYYVDLYQDPAPPPYIFSVYSFTLGGPTSGHSFLPGFLPPVSELIVGVVVLAAIALVAALYRRRKKSPPSSSERSGSTPGAPGRSGPR
jgi:hypothetical protein